MTSRAHIGGPTGPARAIISSATKERCRRCKLWWWWLSWVVVVMVVVVVVVVAVWLASGGKGAHGKLCVGAF